MENFCKHAEGHLTASVVTEEDEEETEGDHFVVGHVLHPAEKKHLKCFERSSKTNVDVRFLIIILRL